MSIADILIQVEKLSAEERAELLKVLGEAEAQDNQQSAEDEESFKTAFDVAPELMNRLCGKHDSGVTDLATNKKHMEGYGRD